MIPPPSCDNLFTLLWRNGGSSDLRDSSKGFSFPFPISASSTVTGIITNSCSSTKSYRPLTPLPPPQHSACSDTGNVCTCTSPSPRTTPSPPSSSPIPIRISCPNVARSRCQKSTFFFFFFLSRLARIAHPQPGLL
ncbi:unnamed protein product [Tuber melanosporum]|uniref:(Perigord truffle) hypothetical protein n=1 Tax=Tuber melanosporum (strain Mel28) TaxID=656061 RepID=D5GG70_TUBMM|nr:uncharacterized protein GSTUM_00007238001 [Tuber melanosporum]CAZ83513.1 unnamed protein product [Tuber melanosporum]